MWMTLREKLMPGKTLVDLREMIEHDHEHEKETESSVRKAQIVKIFAFRKSSIRFAAGSFAKRNEKGAGRTRAAESPGIVACLTKC